MVTAEGVYEPSAYVWNALKTNPKIAKNFLFALESGATRARYGPLIANMIAQHYQSQPEEKQETQP
jgi:hypothetical protein